MDENIRYLLEMYAKMFAAGSPIAAAALCLCALPNNTPQERWHTMCKACHVGFGLAILCAILGNQLLALLGISMDGFRIAGGIILGMLGFDLLKIEFADENMSEEDKKNASKARDIVVTPLAFPIIVGPGFISSLMICQSEATNATQSALAYLNVVLFMLTDYALFYFTAIYSKYLKRSFIQISSRLCGLVVLAMAAQCLAVGVVNFFK